MSKRHRYSVGTRVNISNSMYFTVIELLPASSKDYYRVEWYDGSYLNLGPDLDKCGELSYPKEDLFDTLYQRML